MKPMHSSLSTELHKHKSLSDLTLEIVETKLRKAEVSTRENSQLRWEDRLINKGAVCCAVLSHFSCVWISATLWTVAHQAPLSMRFSRQE